MTGKDRIIIDTNLWISFLLSKKFDFIDKLLKDDIVEIVFCDELLAEFIDVANRPNLRRFFAQKEWELIFEIINECVVFVSVSSEINVCRDKKDNFLLALAKDAKADYLLTGDKDLLVLNVFEKTRIITISEYRKIIQNIGK